MSSSPQIYLTDLNNNLKGKPYPLNVGYIASYLLSQQDTLNIKLYKDPKKLCDEMEQSCPPILGMSNFSWNSQLNLCISKWAKQQNPNLIIVYGGLDLTVNDQKSVETFFGYNPFVDFYIYRYPEETMNYLVKKLIDYDFDAKKMLAVEGQHLPAGMICRSEKGIIQGTEDMFAFQKDLDYIPSPYLTGLLDEFISHKDLFPIFETTRGCPYSCTFCCWGARNLSRLQSYSMGRVIAELDYLRDAKVSNKYLYCADGNFGILKRDLEIAHYLRKMYDTVGFPDPTFLYLAKNNTENIIEIAKILAPIFQVNIARQSENESVLKNIKRANISAEAFDRIQKSLDGSNINNQIEVIYPLPGETLETFYNGLKSIMDRVDPAKVEIRLYPLFLLRGSEMSEPQYLEQFGMKTAIRQSAINSGFRHADSQGNAISSVEVDRVVVETNTFSFQDFITVRVFHLFLCLFQTYKIYSYPLKYLREKQAVNPIVFLQKLVEEVLRLPEGSYPFLSELVKNFLSEIKEELYFIDDDSNIQDIVEELKKREHRRLNIDYILKLLYGNGMRSDFHRFLTKHLSEQYVTEDAAKTIIDYIEAFIVDFNHYVPTAERTVVDPLSGKETALHLSVRESVHRWWNELQYDSKPLFDILDNVYQLTYPGYLNKVLLYRSETKETAAKELIYTLHA